MLPDSVYLITYTGTYLVLTYVTDIRIFQRNSNIYLFISITILFYISLVLNRFI